AHRDRNLRSARRHRSDRAARLGKGARAVATRARVLISDSIPLIRDMPGVQGRESWSELASLVDALLDAAPADRAALIEEMSGGDPARRSTLEDLLVECVQESALLSRSAADIFAALFDDDVAQFPPSLAERYQ